ncbi:MAG: DoxX family protein [Bacteroidota bacterium]
MKKTTTLYWIITSLFSTFMIFTAVPDILMVPEAVTFMNHLGYPNYFIPFIGVAKILGAIAILIPGYPRIKEWAYAGLAYDLIGAVYSAVSTDGFDTGMLFMVLPFSFFILSYVLYHKKIAAVQS